MVGNSVKSDVLPVLAIGGQAALVEYHLTWELEHAERPQRTTATGNCPTSATSPISSPDLNGGESGRW